MSLSGSTPLPASAAGTPAEYLRAFQRVNGDDKLLFAFIDWLLPHLRLKQAQSTVRWDDFWRLFKADGTMGWDVFEKFLRWDCKLNARKLFDLLDETGTGRISKHTVLEVRRQYTRIIDCRHMGLDDLKAVLMRRYGNLFRAWRQIFDPQSRGRCSHADFVRACKEVGFHGDLKAAWAELTSGDIHRPAVMADLDAQGDKLMMDFAGALRKFHGSARDGWYAILRAHGAFGKMTPESFDLVCADMGFNTKFAKKVFSFLDVDSDKAVSLDEWDFLSLWEKRLAADDDSNGVVALRANIGGAPSRPRSQSPSGHGGKTSSWQAAVGGGGGAGEAPSGSIEFLVIMTKEEHREYLTRLQELDARSANPAGRPTSPAKSAVRGPGSPKKSSRASFADMNLSPLAPLA